MNITRLNLHNSDDVNHSILFYFGLPNSRISSVDEEDDDDDDQSSLTSTASDSEMVYQTYFSQIVHKFSVFNDLSFEEIPSDLFLQTCEEYFTLVDKFNSPIFSPVKSDVNGNINKLRRKMNENVSKFHTLSSMINDEIEARTTTARNSATDALLWLKRAFEFLGTFIHEFGLANKTLVEAVTKAYEKTLSRYHGIFARGVFSIALRAVPDNAQFLRSLAFNATDAYDSLFEHQVYSEMLDHSSCLLNVLQKITLFYQKHQLDSTKTV